MKHVGRFFALAALIGASAVASASARAGDQRTVYVQQNLISDGVVPAPFINRNLVNAWGIAFPPGGPFWINSNNAGTSFLVDGTGAPFAFPAVKIPLPAVLRGDNNPNGTGAPTGIVWNGSAGFAIPGEQPPTPALFVFDTEDGTIVAWNRALGTIAEIVVDNSHVGANNGAVYKGLALGFNVTGTFLYATNFRAGTIEVYDATFKPVQLDGTFTDHDLPLGFAPHGIQLINGDLYVAYAKQDTPKHDDVAGAHFGFVNVFDTDGHLIRRFASGGPLNAPWGIAVAPAGFGQFAGDILVGNFGDGKINVYSKDGEFLDQLEGPDGKPVVIDGLWSLTFGGGVKSSPDVLYFSAGPNGGNDGLFGTLTAHSDDEHADNDRN